MALERMTLIIVTAAALGGITIGLLAGNFANEVKRQGEAYADENQTQLLDETTRPIPPTVEKPATSTAEVETTTRLRRIMRAVDSFIEKQNLHPETLEDLVMTGFLPPEDLLDGWGNLFHYHVNHETNTLHVHSLGKDVNDPSDDIPRRN